MKKGNIFLVTTALLAVCAPLILLSAAIVDDTIQIEKVETMQTDTIAYSEIEVAIINFLVRHCTFRDSNPIWQDGAEAVNLFVRKIFEKQYAPDDVPDLVTQTLQMFYDYSRGEYEDAVDIRRVAIRRSMIIMALAFLAEERRYQAFLSDAFYNLGGSTTHEVCGKMLLILNIIHLYKELNGEYVRYRYRSIENNISGMYQDDLKDRENSINDSNYVADYNELLSLALKFVKQKQNI